ncbi:MAG TPA: DUF4097 family beta strand repeat-containing protein [Pyrinomonadaceae bacterium]|nr:DUF4097 family beta strand repeat-containing protein [Pyrinomonadaceae bacterium]
MNTWLRRAALVFIVTLMTAMVGFADQDKSMACRDNWNDDRLSNHCEIKEQTLAPAGALSVDARQNGGVSVKGWDRNEVLLRSRIQTAAPTQAEADALATQVRIETGGAKIFADGPDNRRDQYWSVSYEVFVPRRSDLTLVAHNGGISISDVQGRLEFSAVNGGVSLRRVGGSVHGGTTNGGLSIELAGDRWDGEEMDVKTTNGGISMSLPENYSAHLETGTVNGNLNIDFPVTVQGRITREIAVNLGSGGPTIRAMTTNGGVRIKRGTGSEKVQ